MNQIELGFTAGVVFATLLLNVIYMVYLVLCKLVVAESHLSKSDWICNNKRTLLKAGWIGSVYRLNAIAIVLLMPRLSQKRNLIAISEVQAFPRNLKLMILINYFFLILLLCCMVVVIILSKI